MSKIERRKKPVVAIDDLIKKSVTIAVSETLVALGFDMDNPFNIQKDIHHLRKSREICELLQNGVVKTLIGITIVALLGMIGTGFVSAVHNQKVIEKKND